MRAGISRDRMLAAYPTIQKHDLDLAVSYAMANPLQRQTHGSPTEARAIVVKSAQIPRRRG